MTSNSTSLCTRSCTLTSDDQQPWKLCPVTPMRTWVHLKWKISLLQHRRMKLSPDCGKLPKVQDGSARKQSWSMHTNPFMYTYTYMCGYQNTFYWLALLLYRQPKGEEINIWLKMTTNDNPIHSSTLQEYVIDMHTETYENLYSINVGRHKQQARTKRMFRLIALKHQSTQVCTNTPN